MAAAADAAPAAAPAAAAADVTHTAVHRALNAMLLTARVGMWTLALAQTPGDGTVVVSPARSLSPVEHTQRAATTVARALRIQSKRRSGRNVRVAAQSTDTALAIDLTDQLLPRSRLQQAAVCDKLSSATHAVRACGGCVWGITGDATTLAHALRSGLPAVTETHVTVPFRGMSLELPRAEAIALVVDRRQAQPWAMRATWRMGAPIAGKDTGTACAHIPWSAWRDAGEHAGAQCGWTMNVAAFLQAAQASSRFRRLWRRTVSDIPVPIRTRAWHAARLLRIVAFSPQPWSDAFHAACTALLRANPPQWITAPLNVVSPSGCSPTPHVHSTTTHTEQAVPAE